MTGARRVPERRPPPPVVTDDEVEAVALKMSDRQVRRMPVLSREDETLVGIVSLRDISRSQQSEALGGP